MLVKVEGSNVWAWRGEEGGAMDLILDSEAATMTTTSRLLAYVSPGGQFRFDDVGIEDASHTSSRTLTYNAANELTAMTDGSATINFTYDDWGRMTSKYQAQTYTASYAYRYGSKLYSVSSNFPNEAGVSYQYGGDGKRRYRTAGPTLQTWYNWTGGANVVSEEDSTVGTGNLVTSYVFDNPGMVVAQTLADVSGADPSSGTWHYHLLDHLGSTRRLHAQDKSTVSTFEFDPYGGAYSHGGSPATPLFTGKPWDSRSQLYYFPYRYYAASPARWTSRDPAGMQDGLNMYAYVGGAPASARDELGLDGSVRSSDIELCHRALTGFWRSVGFIISVGGFHHSYFRWHDKQTCNYLGASKNHLPVTEIFRRFLKYCEPLQAKQSGTSWQGKSCASMSDRDIFDCLETVPALGQYDALRNSCNTWTVLAMGKCCLKGPELSLPCMGY